MTKVSGLFKITVTYWGQALEWSGGIFEPEIVCGFQFIGNGFGVKQISAHNQQQP